LNDWPDRYIHTNLDSAANIDATKLKRAAFIGAASGYFLANLSSRDISATDAAMTVGKLMRTLTALQRRTAPALAALYESTARSSLDEFSSGVLAKEQSPRSTAKGEGAVVYHRRKEPRGPMAVFGYDYFADHAKAAGTSTPKLLSYEGPWGSGEEYAYEALNFADGRHSAQQIADALSAEYGAVPPALVFEYLQALKKIGIVDASIK
jgi:hypothetical protein